jgi:hypothetical protein
MIWGPCPKKVYKKSFYITKRVIRYTAGLKHTDLFWRSFIKLKILTLYSLFIYETILFVRQIGNCKTNDTVHSHSTKSFLNYSQYLHNLDVYNCRPTVAGDKFYNVLHARIKLIKDNLLFRIQVKQLLIKG